jgi:hypothetical protein
MTTRQSKGKMCELIRVIEDSNTNPGSLARHAAAATQQVLWGGATSTGPVSLVVTAEAAFILACRL